MNEQLGLRYRRLRAPVDNGAVFVDPPLSEISECIHNNQTRLADSDCSIAGHRLAGLRSETRIAAFDLAARYTGCYSNVESALDIKATWIVSGHQPQLFHPGVWFKNFALDSMRKRCQGLAIHVLIDNDLCRTNSIRVPTGEISAPHLSSVPFDRSPRSIPFEELNVLDEPTFSSFGARVSDKIKNLVHNPIITDTWQFAGAASTENLGQRMSIFRHQIEQKWGSKTLEVPLSWLCQTRPFQLFFSHLLVDASRFRSVHNRLLVEYRRANGIRSEAHPVPNLKQIEEWNELPFWIWTVKDPIRQPMMARPRPGGGYELSNGRTQWRLETDDAEKLSLQVDLLERQGIKIRPRAISNTLFLRLMLADLFLHGIGGAKYDEVTDAIIQEFFEIDPPYYMTLSATLRLPISGVDDNLQSQSNFAHLVRRTFFHPEKFLSNDHLQNHQVSNWIAEKRKWIALQPRKGEGQKRQLAIKRINQQLQPCIEAERESLISKLQFLQERKRIQSILGSREFSFCLFPASSLGPIILRD